MGAAADSGEPGVRVPRRARSGQRGARQRLSHQRPRARLAPVVLPVEQHSRRRAAGPGRQGQAEQIRRCWSSRCAACWPIRARKRWSTTSPASGCTCATCASTSPMPDAFPDFDDNLRQAFAAGNRAVLREHHARGSQRPRSADRGLHVRQRAAGRHYGIPNVYGSQFRRVTLTDDERAGLLGQGSILTVTSYANRTSPVSRQVDPREHPRDASAAAAAERAGAEGRREGPAAADHARTHGGAPRQSAVCAGCHKSWIRSASRSRTSTPSAAGAARDAGAPIDASGTLVDGTQGRRRGDACGRRCQAPEMFVGTMTEKLLTYALGRGLEAHDMPAIRAMTRRPPRQLPLFVARPRHRQQRAVSDEGDLEH